MAAGTDSGATRRAARVIRAVALALALAGLAHAVALAVASTPAFTATLRRRAAAALEARLGPVEIARARVDWRLRLTLEGVRVAPRAGAPAIAVARVHVGPSLRGLLSGRLEPATVALRGVALDGVPLGPFDADARLRRAGGDAVEASARLPTGGVATVAATRGADGWRARVAAALGEEDLAPLLRSEAARLARGTLSLDLDAAAPLDLASASAHVRIAAREVFLEGRRVAPAPIGPLRADAAGELRWEAGARRLVLRGGAVSLLGALPVAVSGELHAASDLPFSLSVRAERVDFAAALAALPPGLALPPEAPRPPGLLHGRLALSGPLADPARWTVDAALDLTELRATGRRAPSPLRAPFVHRPDPGDPARVVRVDPASPDFVPLADLPEHVVRAVTTSEDAGFFAHQGFDFEELRNALAEGAEAGRLVRGGSTITQQLAKNLFLSPERTLARKVREALLAIGLEASLSKRRLLEIYLNVAEWGPGLHGIGPAARHWFGKEARDLTPKEAAFLASIIPSPTRHHAMYARGFVPEAWEARVNDLLFRMTAQGALSDDELVEGLAAPLLLAGG